MENNFNLQSDIKKSIDGFFDGSLINPTSRAEWIAYYISFAPTIKNLWDSVPENYKDKDFICTCISNYPYVIDFLPKECKTEEIWCHFARNIQTPWEIMSRLPAEMQTQSIWNNYFLNKGSNFIFEIPKQFRNQELWDFCQKKSAFEVLKTPSKYQTQDGWNNAVQIRDIEVAFEIINKVPEKFLTKELYDKFLNGNFAEIKYVPAVFQTPEMWNNYFNETGKINFIPEKFQSHDMWEQMLEKDIDNLKYVPSRFQTPEMWTEFVKKDKTLLNYVPRELRGEVANNLKIKSDNITDKNDIDFVVDSIMESGGSIATCSLTTEVIIELMKKGFCSIDGIYKDDINQEIVLEFLNLNKYDFSTIEKIPDNFQNQDIWNVCAEKSNFGYDTLTKIPFEYQTQDMWNNYMKSSEYIDPQKIPDDFQTQSMWDNFFENNTSKIQKYVDFFGGHFMISQDTWDTYAKLHPENIYKIPSQFQTQNMWNEYCKRDATIVINNVPNEFQTPEMWLNFAKKLLSYGKDIKEIFGLIPEKFKSKDLYFALLQEINFDLDIVLTIPKEYQTLKMWQNVIKIHNFKKADFRYIPKEFREQLMQNQLNNDIENQKN